MTTLLPNKIFALLLATAWSLAAFPAPPPFPPGSNEPTAEEPLSGKELYAKECALCHGRQGEGTERGFPLAKPPKAYATHITRRGRSGNPQFSLAMPAYSPAVLPDLKLIEIWTYLASLSIPTTGEEIYRTYCRNCHGPDARGGMSGQPLVNDQGLVTPAEIFDIWVRWGQDDGFYDNRGSYMPRWNRWEISDAQLASVRDYLSSLCFK